MNKRVKLLNMRTTLFIVIFLISVSVFSQIGSMAIAPQILINDGQITVSSFKTGGEKIFLVDGKTIPSYWSANTGEQWAKFDLQNNMDIDEVKVYIDTNVESDYNNSGSWSFSIKGSDSLNGDYTELRTKVEATRTVEGYMSGQYAVYTLSIPADATYRYYQFLFNSSMDTSIDEIEFYGQVATENLSNLVLSGSPTGYSFAGGTYNYDNISVDTGVSSITVTPTGTGTITVNGTTVISGSDSGAIALTEGVLKTITVVATEPGKSPKTYVLKVTRAVNRPETATAGANTITPAVGVDNQITLTVKDSLGNTDTNFDVAKNVTITGVEIAPNGTYGSFNGTALDATAAGGGQVVAVTFTNGVGTANLKLNKADAQTIGFSIDTVATPSTGTLTITPTHGVESSMLVTQNITAPTNNGGQFAQQATITIKDAYGNICTGDNSTAVSAAKEDLGTWTLTGTTTATAVSGVATFTNLGATNSAIVNGAQLGFTAAGMTEVTSNTVNLPAPAGNATAMAVANTSTPVAGLDNQITFTVKDTLGNTDTNFIGSKVITITGGVEIAPNGTYGSFNGIALDNTAAGGGQTIAVMFTNGVGTANLKLNKADSQSIGFSIQSVTMPSTNTLTLTPSHGASASMTVTQIITAPANNGGQFAQQARITLKDAYDNTCTGDNVTEVTAVKVDAGTWTLTGTTTATASSGVASFTNLGATNLDLVNNAQLGFTATCLTQVTSSMVNLPAPAGNATAIAVANTLTPVAGLDNQITFTVKNTLGNTDTNFTNSKNVTITGVEAAPNGLYGSFNGTALDGTSAVGGQTIAVNFVNGVGIANLKLNKADGQTISFSIATVTTPSTNALTITPTHGSSASMTVTQNITAPANNGGIFAQQASITIKDAYGNICTGDNSTVVSAARKDSGTWTLTGTATATAVSGVATFTNLGATNSTLVNSAQLGFTAAGMTEVTSTMVNLPAPAGNATAMAVANTSTPVAGLDNQITFTVKDTLGNTDTNFNGLKVITITGGVEIAPNGTYGSFNGIALDNTAAGGGQTISVIFTNGVATANLKLNKADSQSIGFSIETVTTPSTNTLTLTPSHGSSASMLVTQNITAPANNGGQFAQQATITLKDVYSNICTGDNSTVVSAAKEDSGTWALTGTATATAVSGVATFTDLGATNVALVNNAQLGFTATGMTKVTSSMVNLPAPTQQATPTFTPASGNINYGSTVIITSTGADAIYYTTDGSTPATSVTGTTLLYTNPITIDTAKTIKAIAVKSGKLNSNVGTGSYGQSASADLTDLTLSGNPSNYSFNSSTYAYNGIGVANEVSEITIKPTGSGDIAVNGTAVVTSTSSAAITLEVGVEKTIDVVVSESGKTSKTYTLKVTRSQPNITAPSAPTNVTATAGNQQAVISFNVPTNNGGSAITGYTVVSSPGAITVTGSASPITVTGLTNGTSYLFTVTATNAAGTSVSSAESTAVVPKAPEQDKEDRPSRPETPSTPSAPVVAPPVSVVPKPNGVDIFVNGKVETAAVSETKTVNNQVITTVTVDAKKVDAKLASEGNNTVITIPVNGKNDVAIGNLNGQTVKNMENKDAVLEVKTANVVYTLPASQINIDAISSAIGTQVALKDISVDVKISQSTAQTAQVVENTASKKNYQVVVKPMDFEITCSNGGKTVEVSKFNAYVERMVAIPDGIDPSKITTGIVLNADGTFSHIPTNIVKENGKYFAKINSLTNSSYSVIWSPKTFADAEKHWAKTAINDMGSRLIVTGVDEQNYEPDRAVTRAEFAEILVKSLGLKRPGVGKDAFADVKNCDWCYDSVSTAIEYGLISGYGNGIYGANDQITREQAVTMLQKAMKLTDLKVNLNDAEKAQILSQFKDSDKASAWAKDALATNVKAGIMGGKNDKQLAPKAAITRAEVAVMIRNMLMNSELINK